jgi:hypothetical protein
VYGILFRLDSYGRSSFFVKEDLKAVDFVSIQKIFSSFDNNIVGILWSDGKLRNGSRKRKDIRFLLLFFSGDGLVFLDLFGEIMLKKIYSRDDAEACEDSKK